MNKYFWQGFLSVLWRKNCGVRDWAGMLGWSLVFIVFLARDGLSWYTVVAPCLTGLVMYHCACSLFFFWRERYLRRKNGR